MTGRHDFSCATGAKPFKRKAEVEKAGGTPKKCDRCPYWHDAHDRPRSRRGKKR